MNILGLDQAMQRKIASFFDAEQISGVYSRFNPKKNNTQSFIVWNIISSSEANIIGGTTKLEGSVDIGIYSRNYTDESTLSTNVFDNYTTKYSRAMDGDSTQNITITFNNCNLSLRDYDYKENQTRTILTLDFTAETQIIT